jgi:hypothetical protein
VEEHVQRATSIRKKYSQAEVKCINRNRINPGEKIGVRHPQLTPELPVRSTSNCDRQHAALTKRIQLICASNAPPQQQPGMYTTQGRVRIMGSDARRTTTRTNNIPTLVRISQRRRAKIRRI